MDKKDLLKAIGEVEQEMVEAAAPKGGGSRRPRWVAAGAISAACLLLGVLAISGGWFKRTGTEVSLSSSEEGLPIPGPAPDAAKLVSDPEGELTDHEPGDILYAEEGITVRVMAASDYEGTRGQASRVGMPERELFTKGITLRARLLRVECIEILDERPDADFDKIQASILTLEPIALLHGELKQEGLIRVLVDHMVNTSLERINLGLEGTQQEGLVMIYSVEQCPDDYYLPPSIMRNVTDYIAGDNLLYAIWEKANGGLSYDANSFSGIQKNWNMDQVEAYAREVIEPKPVPEDYYLDIQWRYWGETEDQDWGYAYRSRDGYFSYLESGYYEKRYGAENLSTHFSEDPLLLEQLYNSCLKLKDISGTLGDGRPHGSRDSVEMKISFMENGQLHEIYYIGSYYVPENGAAELKQLFDSFRSFRYYLYQNDSMRAWQTELAEIEEARTSVVLYQKDGVTVQSCEGIAPGVSYTWVEAELAYFTENELFSQGLTLRARLTEIRQVEVIRKRDASEDRHQAVILTLEPITVLHGELPDHSPIRVFVDYYSGTSLEDLDLSLRNAREGLEGLVMLSPLQSWGPAYVAELADYRPGDNQRFAIWSVEGKLIYDKWAYPGLRSDWSLDQAEAYARELIADDEPTPEDFYLSLRYRVEGPEPEDTVCYSFDSRNGFYSALGTSHKEKEYGAENLTTHISVEGKLLKKLYQASKRLKDLPAELSPAPIPGEREEHLEVELKFSLYGEEKTIHYAGSSILSEQDQVNLLILTVGEILYQIHDSQGIRDWMSTTLEPIGDARRLETSRRTAEALEKALTEKYGTDWPDYYLGYEFLPGGYLQILLKPEGKEQLSLHIREIQSLLLGYEVYLFAEKEAYENDQP